MRILLAIACLLGLVGTSIAQNSACSARLTRAEEAFDQGRLQDVLNELNKDDRGARQCFGEFSIDERIRAEKLLTKVYLFMDNQPEAENSLIDLLKVDKEHQLAKNDPSELHFLYSQYKTEPIFRIGLRAGVNHGFTTRLQSHNTFQGTNKDYNPDGLSIGINVEALVERHIKSGIEVGAGVQFRAAQYKVKGNLLIDSKLLNYDIANQSTMLRFPLLVRYNFNYDKKNAEGIRLNKMFYVFAGGSFDYVLNATYLNSARNGGTAFTLTDEDGSLTDINQVTGTNASIFGGIGVKLRFGRSKVDFLILEARYDNGLFNYIDPDNRYANPELNFSTTHVEDDLTLNTVTFTVGYTKSFYNPKKRKQYR